MMLGGSIVPRLGFTVAMTACGANVVFSDPQGAGGAGGSGEGANTATGSTTSLTGAGGNDGTPSSPCTSCARSQPCDAPLAECNADPDCVALTNCLIGCQLTYSCVDQCFANQPPGASAYLAVVQCEVCQGCFVECQDSSVATFCLEN